MRYLPSWTLFFASLTALWSPTARSNDTLVPTTAGRIIAVPEGVKFLVRAGLGSSTFDASGAAGVDAADESLTGKAGATEIEASVATVCSALRSAAAANDLPLDFFTRIVWQESRFDPNAVSRAGAQGIAQFMPATAAGRRLTDPFNPIESLRKSADYLNELRVQFGNLGLAAAAYNAGPQRVQDWLTKRRALPRETKDYVRIITGKAVEDWAVAERQNLQANNVPAIRCPEIAQALLKPVIETRNRDQAGDARLPDARVPRWRGQSAGRVAAYAPRHVPSVSNSQRFWAEHDARVRRITAQVHLKWARLARKTARN